MADNSYNAFDAVFWSYHVNIDRIFEIWLRAHPTALFNGNTPLGPFAGLCAESLAFEDPRRFIYTTIGDIAKDSRGLGYDYAAPVDPDFVGPHATMTGRTSTIPPASGYPASATAAKADGTPALAAEELLIRFADVRCTFDSYAIDAFLNLPDPTPDDFDAANPHYVGRLSRVGMGVVDDKGRCITQACLVSSMRPQMRTDWDWTAERNATCRSWSAGSTMANASPNPKHPPCPAFTLTIGSYRYGRTSGFQLNDRVGAGQPPPPACCGAFAAR
jgi:Common central domain of tyrosinase